MTRTWDYGRWQFAIQADPNYIGLGIVKGTRAASIVIWHWTFAIGVRA